MCNFQQEPWWWRIALEVATCLTSSTTSTTVRMWRIFGNYFRFSSMEQPRAHPRKTFETIFVSFNPFAMRIVLSPDASLLWETGWGGVDSFLFRAFWFWGDGKNFSNVFSFYQLVVWILILIRLYVWLFIWEIMKSKLFVYFLLYIYIVLNSKFSI